MKTNLLSLGKTVCTILLTPALIFCFSISSIATTFYISPFGNDVTGNGTLGNPWKTLYKATSTVTTSGNIIHVNAGTYTETQTCNLAIGVSIEGDGVTSVIRSTVSADWIPLLRAASNSEGIKGNQHISNVKFDGQNLTTFWGIEIVGRSNFSIYNCTIVDFDDRGVIYNGRVDNGNEAPTIYATGNSFHDNIMTNCARYTPGYGAGCLNIGGQRGMLVYNNTISQDSRSPGNNGWPIKYWNDGYLDDCRIYNNTLNKIMNHDFLGNGCWDFAIELFNVRGLQIYNNIMNGGGIDLNYQDKGPYAYSVWIHHNTVQMPYINNFIQTAVTLEFQSETVIIEDNIFDKVTIGVNYTPRPGDAVTDNTIRRNLITNVGRGEGTGFFITFGGGGGSGETFNNLNIYNNTMTMDAGIPCYWGIDLPNLSSGSISNVNIKNNIIRGAISAAVTQYSSVGTNTLNISNNNMYQNGNNNTPYFADAPAPTSYTYANNLHGINPLFVGAGNYTLQATSPCIDAGIYVGLPYTGIAPDRGFAEYGSIILPITLLDFTGKENAGKNLLNWNTASESNSSYFSIERSTDALNFSSIGHVNASGFSSTEVKYNFTDATPIPGVNYYRLVMIDKDGSSAYSKIVSITNKINHSIDIKHIDLFARSNTMSLIINSTKTQTANLSIIDVSGRTILNTQIFLQNGNNVISKNIPSITKGIYYVKLFTPEETVLRNTFTPN